MKNYFSVARRTFIEAKYVQKAFLRPLPSANEMESFSHTIKRSAMLRCSTSHSNNDDTFKLSNHQLLPKFVFYFRRYRLTLVVYLI